MLNTLPVARHAPPAEHRARLDEARQCAAQVIDVVPGIMDCVRASMRRHIGDGLSVPQFRCLEAIARQPRASISDVAASLGVTLATASAMVDRLVRAGHVVASTSTTDRRRSELVLSDLGDVVLGEIRQGARGDIAAALAHHDADDLAALMRGLAVLQAAFATTLARSARPAARSSHAAPLAAAKGVR